MRTSHWALVFQHTVALLLVALALAVGIAFEPALGGSFPFATLIIAVMFAGWYGGLGPGLTVSLVGALGLMRFVLKWKNGFDLDIESHAGFVLYLFVTIGISALAGGMRRARHRAEQRTAEVMRVLEEKLLAEQNLNRTARQLERSDAFHRLITDLTSDFTFRVDFAHDGSPQLDFVSPGFVSVTGLTLEQVQRRGGCASIVLADDLPIVSQTIAITRQGQSDRNELRILNHAGQICWFRYLTQPSYDAAGRIIGLVGAAEHITEHKRLEEVRAKLMTELAEKNAFIEAVLGQVPVGIIVADPATGQLVTSNREAHRITQIDFQPGMPISEILEEYALRGARVDGSSYEAGQWPLQRAIAGETIQDEKVTLSSGDDSPLMLSVNAGPIVDPDGRVIAAVSVFHDESARRQSEENVRESQRFLRCSLDALSSHIAVLDEKGDILEVNEAWRRFADENNFEYFRYGVGSNYLEPFETAAADPCGDGPAIARGIRQVMQGEREAFEYEYPCHSPQEQRWFLLRVTRFTGPGPTRVVVAHENVTKLRVALDALHDADRRKDEFLATLAHELRNPLAPIRNAIHILKMPSVDRPTVTQTVDMMERQASQLTRLVDDLMDVSRVMRGKIELRLKTVDLAEVIQQAVETATPLVSAKHHTLELDLEDRPLLVRGDAMRLSQVIGNLITNAAKYTEPDGRIEITSRSEDSTAIIRIRDNGIGIRPEQLTGIFDLFMQVDHATTRAQGGLGIGLTLVKNLVELHGGSVRAYSPGLQQGSEFVVRLPLLVQSAPADSKLTGSELADSESDAFASESASASKCRILVVDDNRDAANSLALLLRALGHAVDVAHSGPGGLSAAVTLKPQVVFLDIGMPEMDGYEVARRLRANPATADLCLAALTGWGQAEDRRRTAEAGFDHHIVKPPALPEITAVLREASEKKSHNGVGSA